MIFALIPRLRNCNVARVLAKGSGVERWRGVCSGEWGLRLLRTEESARARTETTKPAAKRKFLLNLLSSPLMRLNLHVESFCGAIAAAAPAPEAAGFCGTAGRLRCCCAPGCSLGLIGGSTAQEPYIDANLMLISALVRSEHHAVVTPTVVRTFASRARTGKTARARSARKR